MFRSVKKKSRSIRQIISCGSLFSSTYLLRITCKSTPGVGQSKLKSMADSFTVISVSLYSVCISELTSLTVLEKDLILGPLASKIEKKK